MSYGSHGAWKKWSDQRQWRRAQWEPNDCWSRNGRWSGNDTPGRNPGDRVGDEESSWKLVKKRKTNGKNAVLAAGSEKDQQAVTDTKAKRTFFEVVLGDNPAIQGEVKPRSLSDRRNGSLSWKAGLKKAESVLKERLGPLDGERVLVAKMTAELFQNTDTNGRMDTDVSVDELEKEELGLLRKFASACKQNQFGESENEVKTSVL